MWCEILWTLFGVSTVGFASHPPYSLNPSDYDAEQIIDTDVVIIGGGSSGTYTAVRLKDHGKNVIVIEKEAKLGGHAQTYTAPNGYTIDYGVIVFAQSAVVNNYFARFNISLATLSGANPPAMHFDFTTGQDVTMPAQNATAIGLAFEAYGAQLAKYPELQQGFNMTYPVAPDLLLTFGSFVKKYNLEALVPTIYITNQGYAPILDIPMLYMFKYLNADQLNSIANGYQTTLSHDIYALYAAAASYLGESDLLMSSTPLAMDRSSSPVKILVHTPAGRKLIMTKKLVSTIPPTLHKLAAYDLTSKEKNLFSQWHANGYYTGILNGTNLPSNVSLLGAQVGRPYNIPNGPGIYSLNVNTNAENLVQVYYGSVNILSSARVKTNIEAAVKVIQKSLGVNLQKPEWVAFSSHAPFNLEVSQQAIEDGFYKRLLKLQGKRNTFWNGAAWMAQDSSVLWQFTEDTLLPDVLSTL